jgi:uridine kinase
MVPVQFDGRRINVAKGSLVGDLFQQHRDADNLQALAAIVDHRLVDLDCPVTAPCDISAVDYGMREGVLVYRRTGTLLLMEAARRLFGQIPVAVSQAHGAGYSYHVDLGDELTKEHVVQLEQQLTAMVEKDVPLEKEIVTLTEARRIFGEQGAVEQLRLLKTWWDRHVTLIRCGELYDIHHYPVAPSARYLTSFALAYHSPGFFFRLPPRGRPTEILPYLESPKLEQVYQESAEWLRQLGVSTVGQLNGATQAGDAGELIRIAEGLHEKRIGQIADNICSTDRDVRLVCIAGPSSSGKTTFSKRLSLQLRVNGVRPIALSTDNFYIDREDTPLDEDGNYDFESVEAIDLSLFNEVLAKLLRGEEVLAPRFDFTVGKRRERDKWVPMKLEPGQVLIVEGIHGLNPRLTESVDAERKFGVYVSALTQLCIDDHNRIFTSDTRLIRRIVRDRRYRGYSATDTIEIWPRVRKGEKAHIFKFQEQADVMFNSALIYEHAVLSLYATRYLLEVDQGHPAFVTAHRLLNFLSHFVPMFDENVPEISILREFMGGSFFSY